MKKMTRSLVSTLPSRASCYAEEGRERCLSVQLLPRNFLSLEIWRVVGSMYFRIWTGILSKSNLSPPSLVRGMLLLILRCGSDQATWVWKATGSRVFRVEALQRFADYHMSNPMSLLRRVSELMITQNILVWSRWNAAFHFAVSEGNVHLSLWSLLGHLNVEDHQEPSPARDGALFCLDGCYTNSLRLSTRCASDTVTVLCRVFLCV